MNNELVEITVNLPRNVVDNLHWLIGEHSKYDSLSHCVSSLLHREIIYSRKVLERQMWEAGYVK